MSPCMAIFWFACWAACGWSTSQGARNLDFVYDADASPGECIFRGNQTRGVCRPVTKCSQAVDELNRLQIQPTSCGFSGTEPIVCCGVFNENVVQTLRISNEKCISHRPRVRSRTLRGLLKINVVGGEKTAPDEFPHMVALGWTDTTSTTIAWKCGGTLISERFVLTAAHCVVRSQPDVVRIGESHGSRIVQGRFVQIEQIHTHPDYKPSRAYDDIALVRLKNEVLARPACLWQTEAVQTELMATGFGLTEFGGRPSDGLLKVNLTLVETSSCAQMYVDTRKLPNGLRNSQLCAGDAMGERDTCQGDSGGPLQLKRRLVNGLKEYHVVGITSFGKGCATQTPGVYTRVSHYLDWIEGIVWPR